MGRAELIFVFLASCSSETTANDRPGTGGGGDLTDSGTQADGNTPGSDAASGDAGGDASPKPLGPPRVYVGSSDGKIRIYSFDTTTATLDKTPVQTVDAGNNPSFLAFDPERRFLYAVDENQSQVRAFSIESTTGKLTQVGTPLGSGGNGPAHVSVDRAGKVVMVANYGGSTISVFPRQNDGSLGASVATRSFGANSQTHQIVTDPTNKWVFVPNKGKDAVSVFGLGATGALTDVSLAGFPAGDGARHIDFDSASKHAYVLDELGNTVIVMTLDAATGQLATIQTLSSLEPTFVGQSFAAEIQLTPDGKHVLASNRGDDSLMVFDVNPADGKLTRTTRVPTGGVYPRHFSIDETGKFLFVGNQTSSTVITMKVDATTGVPSPVGTPLTVASPGYVALVYLPL